MMKLNDRWREMICKYYCLPRIVSWTIDKSSLNTTRPTLHASALIVARMIIPLELIIQDVMYWYF